MQQCRLRLEHRVGGAGLSGLVAPVGDPIEQTATFDILFLPRLAGLVGRAHLVNAWQLGGGDYRRTIAVKGNKASSCLAS